MELTLSKKQLAFAGLGLGLGFSLIGGSAHATAVDDLQTETAKLSGIYDVIVPIAVGSGVFAMAFQFVKRVAYA